MRISFALPVLLVCPTLLLAQVPSGTGVGEPKEPAKLPSIKDLKPIAAPAVGTAVAKPPDKLPSVTLPSASPSLTTFQPLQVQVRWVNGNWEIKSGNVCLKDFGKKEHEAREAMNIIRRLNLTQRGTIGTPMPIMEYWLADGKAPRAFGSGLRLTPIDRSSVRVEAIQNHWCVRDNQRLLFNFGSQEQDARQALDVIQKYGFNQIGYVGSPTPSMIYFVTSHSGIGTGSSLQSLHASKFGTTKEEKVVVPAAGTVVPENEPKKGPAAEMNPLLLQQAQLLAKGMQQLAPPPIGGVTRLRFEGRQMQVKRDKNEWKIFAGQHVLANFGTNAAQARDALSLLQHYHCNEQCLIGLPVPTFSYFLASGRAPIGLHHDLKGRSFQPDMVAVRQHQNSWYVCEDTKPLLFFGDRKQDAQELVEAIQRHHFDYISQFGPPGEPVMSLLLRTK
jgi:hypothetical protein